MVFFMSHVIYQDQHPAHAFAWMVLTVLKLLKVFHRFPTATVLFDQRFQILFYINVFNTRTLMVHFP